MSDRIEVRKLGYSRSPWRLVIASTGEEVVGPCVEFDHPSLGKTWIRQSGWDTKADAIAYLGELVLAIADERDHWKRTAEARQS